MEKKDFEDDIGGMVNSLAHHVISGMTHNMMEGEEQVQIPIIDVGKVRVATREYIFASLPPSVGLNLWKN
jgi:hypothetical protein